jgi:hypothetical protein
MIEADAAFEWVLRIAAVSAVIGGAEQLQCSKPLRDEGLMSWRVGCLRSPLLIRGRVGATLDLLLRYPNVLGVIAARVLVGAAIALGPPTLAQSDAVLWLMALLVALQSVRNPFGQDGSDQMQWIIFLGAAVTSLAGTSAAKTIFLWFVGAQACLAYATAGYAKALAPGWRDGRFLAAIMSTGIYGQRTVGRMLSEHTWLSKWLSLAVIGWECAFPLVLIAPQPIARALLAGGVFFHLANSSLMGLNLFLWSFLATYPALLYWLSWRGW